MSQKNRKTGTNGTGTVNLQDKTATNGTQATANENIGNETVQETVVETKTDGTSQPQEENGNQETENQETGNSESQETKETEGTGQPQAGTENKVEDKVADTKKGPVVKILTATYGRNGKTIQVENYLNELPNGGHGRAITNKLFGNNDPLKGMVKDLEMTYTVNGVERTGSFREKEKISLDLTVSETTTPASGQEVTEPATETVKEPATETVKETVTETAKEEVTA